MRIPQPEGALALCPFDAEDWRCWGGASEWRNTDMEDSTGCDASAQSNRIARTPLIGVLTGGVLILDQPSEWTFAATVETPESTYSLVVPARFFSDGPPTLAMDYQHAVQMFIVFTLKLFGSYPQTCSSAVLGQYLLERGFQQYCSGSELSTARLSGTAPC